MIEVKTLKGGLNKDDSLYQVPTDDYIEALNISHDGVESEVDSDISTVVANRIGDAAYEHPIGRNVVIGSYANTLRNTIIDFVWNSNDYHVIREFNATTRTYTKVLSNLTDSDDIDILGFLEDEKITSVDIYNRDEGDLLYFIDSLGRPTELDLSLSKAGTYTPVTRAIIDKARKPPLSPPAAVYGNDTTRRSNSFRNKLFRFKYRWIYFNLEKSTFSPISTLPLPVSILNDTYTNVVTNNNVIRMVANTGDKNVKGVEIAVSFVEKTNVWSDFLSVAVIDKSTLVLGQNTNVQDSDFYDTAFTQFNNIPSEGDVVNIYLTELPEGTEILAGTYEVQAGDELSDIAAGMVANMFTLGVVTSPYSYTDTVAYSYQVVSFVFNRVDIIASAISALDNLDLAYSFYNDSTYPVIDIEESIQLFDYVPDEANAQAMPNGNVLVYGGITEGYDKDTVQNDTVTVLTTPASGSGGGGSFNSVRTVTRDVNNSNYQNIRYQLSGVPVVGTLINVKVKRRSDHAVLVASTYTTVAGDTIYTVQNFLRDNETLPDITAGSGYGGVVFNMLFATYEEIEGESLSLMEIVAPSTATASNSIATWLWSTEKTLGRVYFDEKGKTNGVLYTNRVTFPAYDEDGSMTPLLPYINYKINDTPPIWAHSMVFVATKEGTIPFVWQTLSVNKDEAEYIYLEVTSIDINAAKKPATSTVLSYTYNEGDRLRVWRGTDNLVKADTYDAAIEGYVTDPEINNVPKTGKFLKIKSVEPLASGLSSSLNYVIEVYRPAQQSANSINQTFYEFGRQYYIVNPTLPNRYHSGEVTDQVIGSIPAEYNFYEGDFYFRERTIAISEVGYSTFNVMDKNFVDTYVSAVNGIDGRPNIIDLNARRAYYSTMVRFGQAYQANTNLNGLNRFYAKNFDEYDYSFGDIMRLRVRDRQMRVFQKNKLGVVPIYSSLGKDAGGLQVVFQTDKLLNPIQYYVGNFGIGTCPESLASFNYADYGCDNIRGVVWRVSNDGITPLSILYKMNTWANENLVKANQKIYGAFDQRLNNYIITINENVEYCSPVFVHDFTLPDGTSEVNYLFTTSVNGSPDFELSNVVKPDWMTISVSGNTITFEGLPLAEAENEEVSFDISNECGEATVSTLTFNITDMVTGTIVLFGGASVPTGWLLCDHSAVSRLTYANLFAAIGTLHGSGDGSTTFNLPDAKKKVVAGYDVGDAEYNTIGGTGGSGTATLTDQQIAHNHTYDKYSDDGSGVSGDDGPTNFSYVSTDTSSVGNAAIARDAIDTRDAYVVLPYIIKA